MMFEFTHKIFGTKKWYKENELPSWLEDWFVENYVKTLPVGCTEETDFQHIKRVE